MIKKKSTMHQETIAVFGLGRIGLPLALKFCEAGFQVYGVDVDPKRIALIKEGRFPFVEKGGQELLNHVQGKLIATQDASLAVQKSSDIILSLGTNIDNHKNPNFDQIMDVMNTIKPDLKKGHHLILRSTVSPKFPQYLANHLNDTTGWKVGKDLFVSHCPERIAEGFAIEEISTIPQIIGADDPVSLERAKKLFSAINKKLLPGSTKNAAAAKLICNMSRYILFAISNDIDMWMRRLDVDSEEVYFLANEDYKRRVLNQPGLTAGPCLVKDGNISQEASFLYQAAEITNEEWPLFYSKKIAKMKNLQGKKVSILGTAFKADVDDDRNSLSHKIIKFFEREFATISLHDPYLNPTELPEVLSKAEVVIIAVNHSTYREKNLLADILETAHPDAILWDAWNIFGFGWDPKSLSYFRDNFISF